MCCGRLGGVAPGARSIAVLGIARGDAFATMRAGDDRVTVATAADVYQRQWRGLAACEPAIAELHQGDETRIEIEAHFGQAIFLA